MTGRIANFASTLGLCITWTTGDTPVNVPRILLKRRSFEHERGFGLWHSFVGRRPKTWAGSPSIDTGWCRRRPDTS